MKIYQEYHEKFIKEENLFPFNLILRRNYYTSWIFSIGIFHISLSSFDLFFLFSEFKKITKYDNEMYSLFQTIMKFHILLNQNFCNLYIFNEIFQFTILLYFEF